SAMSGKGGWGARIRTWDHGTKTRCLTTWPRPKGWGSYLRSVKTKKSATRAKMQTNTIAVQKTTKARIAATTASSWETAKIHESWWNVSERVLRPLVR